MLKQGGCLVYSTCALSPEENDRVVARATARYRDRLFIEKPELLGRARSSELAGAEETEYGLMILPDRAGGSGPMFVCRMRKARG